MTELIVTTFKKYIGSIADYHLLVALSAAAFAYSSTLQLSITPDLALITLIFFATLMTYNVQNLLSRHTHLERETGAGLHTAFALAGAAGLLICLVNIDWALTYWLVPPALFSLLYTAPVVPCRGQRVGLREIPWLKLYLILFVWLWVCVVLPFAANQQSPDTDLFLLLLQQGFFLIALLIPFDIRDLSRDLPFQRTIPQIIGTRWSVRVAVAAVLLYGATAVIRYLNSAIDEEVFAALLLTGIAAGWLVALANESRSGHYYTVWVDSLLWLQLVLILLLTGLF
ncbi:MAG: hypothetical protein WD355_11125 [Balneolaceae bacterium]